MPCPARPDVARPKQHLLVDEAAPEPAPPLEALVTLDVSCSLDGSTGRDPDGPYSEGKHLQLLLLGPGP